MITRLEIFNLKDYAAGKTAHIAEISRLQEAINEGSPIRLKQTIREIIEDLKRSGTSANTQQIDKLITILYDIDILKSYYTGKPLKARIGSDSTGRSPKIHGMGLAIKETLPKRAQRQIVLDCRTDIRETIPIRINAYNYTIYVPHESDRPFDKLLSGLATIFPVFGLLRASEL